MITLEDVRAEAMRQLEGVPEGDDLDARTAALVAFAAHLSVTTLDTQGGLPHARKAMEQGATEAQLVEILLLVSALGVHSLFEGVRLVRGLGADGAPRDAGRQRLWDEHVGGNRYWEAFEQEVPGFLDGLLQTSPPGFDLFFRYCALPWQSAQLPPLTKELVAMAVDATPTHRFLPGLRLHLRNAIKLGAGSRQIVQVLDVAAATPAHAGIP